MQLHPQEVLLQQARALQRSEAFGEYRQRRVVVEHRLVRLVQLGIRQSRYFGRAKTKFQLYLAATVANLTLLAAKAGLPANTGGGSSAGSALRAGSIRSALEIVSARLGRDLDPGLACVGLTAGIHFPEQGFPARFPGHERSRRCRFSGRGGPPSGWWRSRPRIPGPRRLQHSAAHS